MGHFQAPPVLFQALYDVSGAPRCNCLDGCWWILIVRSFDLTQNTIGAALTPSTVQGSRTQGREQEGEGVGVGVGVGEGEGEGGVGGEHERNGSMAFHLRGANQRERPRTTLGSPRVSSCGMKGRARSV